MAQLVRHADSCLHKWEKKQDYTHALLLLSCHGSVPWLRCSLEPVVADMVLLNIAVLCVAFPYPYTCTWSLYYFFFISFRYTRRKNPMPARPKVRALTHHTHGKLCSGAIRWIAHVLTRTSLLSLFIFVLTCFLYNH